MVLDRQSETFAPTGNMAGEGFLNPLGRPALDALTVMLREAVQNSWDARRAGGTSIDFALDGFVVDDRGRLSNLLFGDRLREAAEEFLPWAASDGIHTVLAISDRRTNGLGGPTRADTVSSENVPRDFVDFFRNIGEPPDKTVATGGTYGFGKAALYLASGATAIVAYTAPRYGGLGERRLMAAAVGPRFDIASGKNVGRYTGRHWFGRKEGDLVEPLLDSEADEIASSIGLPIFKPGETGTTIAVLNPRFEGDFGFGAMVFLVEGFLWYFWPKLIGENGKPTISFSATWNSTPVPVPALDDYVPLNLYAAAYRDAINAQQDVLESGRIVSIVRKHHQRIGVVAARRGPVRSRPNLAGARVTYPRPIGTFPLYEERSRHFAYMRGPRLIVGYQPAAELFSDAVEYAGVFIADDKFDRLFADSEPPAHDIWVVESQLDPAKRAEIRSAFKEMKEAGHAMANVSGPQGPEQTQNAMGEFAGQLGAILLGEPGDGPSTPVSEPGTRQAGPRGPRIAIEGDRRFVDVAGTPCVVVAFTVRHRDASAGTRVAANAAVILDDGSTEAEPPADSDTPTVIGFYRPDGEFMRGASVEIRGPSGQRWSVVSTVGDFLTGVSLDGEAIEVA